MKTEASCHRLNETRNNYRQRFLNQGLMLAQMHPFHRLGGNTQDSTSDLYKPLYVAGIPLLMVRRMHRQDHVFMKEPQEIAAYESYFGVSRK